MKKKILHILFWSVLSAAFIGPGTVTTAAAAGADYGTALIWTLLFSTVATLVLQEGVARLRLITGQPVGRLIMNSIPGGRARSGVAVFIFLAIFSGCAAYEAGNILGALSGIHLFAPVDRWLVVTVITFVSFLLLWNGSTTLIARVLGGVVAIMGICFLYGVMAIRPNLTAILHGFIPTVPSGASYLALALIGTTVVPYNIFLGAGLKSDQNMREMRLSMSIAIGLGGLISIAVLITGAAMVNSFSFEGLYITMEKEIGWFGGYLLAVGLSAAGLTSAVTAPFAASLTAQSLFSNSDNQHLWNEEGRYFRAVWILALATGFVFGISRVEPVPAIILAQTLNGLILPFITIFLYNLLNDGALLKSYKNVLWQNVLLAIIILITLILGGNSIISAVEKITGS